MESLRVIDLCCGAGLFSMGFEMAGFKVVLGVDNDPVALSSFQDNFPNALVLQSDLLNIDSLPNCDVIIGGPPCQEFSKANRDPKPLKGYLLVEKFLDLAINSGVKYWIMEEVPGVAEYLKDYDVRVEIWNCSDFGARNLRPRLFAGKYPDPSPIKAAVHNPDKTVMASDTDLPISEIKALMGVPSWMVFNGNETDQRRQIGNGVPIEMGIALGMGIINDIKGKAVSNHKPWHKTLATFYRRMGGNRSYLSIKGWKYCIECKTMVEVANGNE